MCHFLYKAKQLFLELLCIFQPELGIDTVIMETLRHMLLKGMIVFSGTGQKLEHKFQIGAAGLAKNMEQCSEQFESFGECVAQKAVELFRW